MDSRGSLLLDPSSAMAAITRHKAEAIKLAREQGIAVKEMCRRAKTDVPPYEFEELIGKGAYGRVYKGREAPSGRLVAIKVLDVDKLDYNTLRDFRDESIKDFIHETKVMKQVKDSGAKNINEIIEAISIHSQLWLVCEYCPGGSVRTLMRATNDRLEEKYIIPIARELAVGLHAIHEAGIIHRDVKAANILIHEEGRLEICDFGVAGVLQSQRDKRSTWIGTPHWMPPEMFATRGEAHKYGSEIDVWAYGCTLFEFATGNPPNSGLRERMQIGRQLHRNTPKLDSAGYSDGLKDLIAFALDSNPATRPTMADILAHPYIANTEEEYPTSSVSELVRNYYQWSQRGGQRVSLFHPGGAAAAELPGTEEAEDDWNFSTTDGFERRFSVIDLDQIAASLAALEEDISPTTPLSESELTEDMPDIDMDPEQKANFDERVRRGAAAMEGLFDEEKPSYKYETKNDFVPIQPLQPVSDLPLRTETDRSSVTSTFIDIDIGSFDSSHYAAGTPSAQPFQLANADTIRANRSSLRGHRNSNENSSQSSNSDAEGSDSHEETFKPSGPRPPTMDWKFPGFMLPEEEVAKESLKEIPEPEPEPEPTPAPATAPEPAQDRSFQAEKRATMEWTFPVMSSQADEAISGHNEVGHLETLRAPHVSQPPPIEELSISRPSTSASHTSTMSDSDYDPFRFDRPTTPQAYLPQRGSSFDSAFPVMTESTDDEGSDSAGLLDGPGPDEEDEHPLWSENTEIFSENNIPPLPTAIPFHGGHRGPQPSASEPGSPIYDEPLQTARRDFNLIRNPEPPFISFPPVYPPSMESLMEGADDATITAELDRLLGDFLGALSATGMALSTTTTERQRKPGSFAETI
ncbi:hypothetical protein N7539_001170 [Penicillium diatomitis]|uniref:non-specific serine/threonine protein kinase n=1 Tax=Penicillium diatomitis TaxID=2819901 RepID=A0A9W9XPL8_9EURO|nr:uncharacterized protein N7539_001170 [Penicillium diatomitis]KAJ5496054.1 hypothetical protein N7539_001170 [Penicillium diatomitis]